MVLYSSKLTTPEPVSTTEIPTKPKRKSKTPPTPEPQTPNQTPTPPTKRRKPTPKPAPAGGDDGVGSEVDGVWSEATADEIKAEKGVKVKKELSEKQKEAIERRRLKRVEDEERKVQLEKELEDAKKLLEEKKEWLKEKRRIKREERLKRDQISRVNDKLIDRLLLMKELKHRLG